MTPPLILLNPRLKSLGAFRTNDEPSFAPSAQRAVLARVAFMSCAAVEHDPVENACWFQTTPPFGKYPSGMQVELADGKKAKDAFVVFSRESVDAVVKDFRERMTAKDWPGVLVDQEHFSLDLDKPSTALAWAKDIRVADDGSIWTRWEFTAKGRELYEGKMLISRSPVLDLAPIGDREFAPTRLTSIGMTNTPYFKDLSPLAAARDVNHNNQGENMDPKILTELGLKEGATLDDVLAAIKALKDTAAAATATATDATKKAEDAEAKCRGLKCDAFIAAHKNQIADEGKFREAYMKAPEATEQALGLFKTAAAPAPTARIVAKNAQTPSAVPGTDDAVKAKIAARNNAVNAYMTAHKCSFQTAWTACRAADPESFKD